MKTYDFLPCPFCGSADLYIASFYFGQRQISYSVICDNCKTQSGRYSSTDKAAEAWNTRSELKEDENLES